MILGTLTVNQPLIFGVLLLLVTVIPYYIFSSLNIPGPSCVANNPPTNIARPLVNASSGATGKLIGKLKATIKKVEDGPGIFNELKM
jgi:hypothetical protein